MNLGKQRKIPAPFVAIAITSLWASVTHAQWQKDGVAVTVSPSAAQERPATCEDGAGGLIVAWTDSRNGNPDIYAQRLDADGNRLWGDMGVPVCVDTNSQHTPEILSDSFGGAIIVWRDRRFAGGPLFAQRVDAQGNMLWTVDGTHASNTNATFPFQRVVADGAGGSITSWLGDANPVVQPDQWSAYSQRLDGSGAPQWSFPWGNASYDVDVQPLNLSIAPDGFGGVLLAWYLNVGGTDVQRLDADGNKLWGANGVEVYDVRGTNLQLSVSEDGVGGAFVAWSNNFGSLHVQHVTSQGQGSWVQNGIVLPGTGGIVVRSVSDNQGGAICVWGGSFEILAQRVDTLGTLQWGPNGTTVSAAPDTRLLWRAAPDGLGGVLAAWTDRRDRPEQDIYIQRIDSNGNAVWLADGVGVCTAPGFQSSPRIVSDGAGGAITAWEDDRGAFTEIYAQRVDNTGTPVPTFLKRHSAFFSDNAIHVEWTVVSTEVTPRFSAYRARGGSEWQQLVGLEIVGDGSQFRFTDSSVLLGESYRYRVHVEDELGPRILFETGTIQTVAPTVLSSQSFPNPFNPATTIRYTLPQPSRVTLTVYSVDGTLVRILDSGFRPSGQHEVVWRGDDANGRPVGSGVYVYRLRAGNQTVSGKIVLLK